MNTKLPVHYTQKGTPYIKYEDIKEALPAHALAEFREWIYVQTTVLLDDGGTGIYPWDWDNFLAHIEGRPKFWD